MGIPSYFSHIVKKYPQIVQAIKNRDETYDHLFMDSNSIIYDCLRSIDYDSNYESNIITAVIAKIEDYIDTIKPSKTIFIAYDGVAPLAKMNQQKTRRYKSDFQSNNNYLNEDTPHANKWSTSNVTPGTSFMIQLSKAMNQYFLNKEKQYHVDKIIVSAADEPGEGEHKLFHYIRQNIMTSGNVALYGLDADLIMLSIFHMEYVRNIYIFREAPVFMNVKEKEKFDDENELLTLDIHSLCDYIVAEMSCQYPTRERLSDYTFMCFLLGNDFLPHFPALNIRTHGIHVLLELYNSLLGNHPDRGFIKNKKLQWRWIQLFIQELAKCEYQYLKEEYDVRKKSGNRGWLIEKPEDKEYIFNNIPVIYRAQENYICPTEKGWEYRYYKTLFKSTNNPDFMKELCNNYLEGLEWVYYYYTDDCVDWKWKYNYHYPPLLKDLQHHIPHFEVQFLEKNTEQYSPYLQLIYVLPRRQYDLLPKKIRDYVVKYYGEISAGDCEFQWAFCRYFWECHVDFPHVDSAFLDKIEREIRVM